MLPFASSFKIFINVFTFLYVKANSKEIGEEIFSLFFSEKCWCQHFLLRFKANYLEKMRGYPHFSFWIPIAFAKIYFFRMVPIWRRSKFFPISKSEFPPWKIDCLDWLIYAIIRNSHFALIRCVSRESTRLFYLQPDHGSSFPWSCPGRDQRNSNRFLRISGVYYPLKHSLERRAPSTVEDRSTE